MKSDFVKTLAMLILLITLTKVVSVLPWWTFILPVMGLGVFITVKKYKIMCFPFGFCTGFLMWILLNITFDVLYKGNILQQVGLLHVAYLLLASGLIGGVLTGLALYAGKLLVYDKGAERRL